MKQRLAIALAVMHDPELLILDEPINGLDPIGIAEVRSFIRELCDTRGKTILISSHILSEISLLADDIGIIDHGALLEEESLAELEQKSSKHIRFTLSDTAQAARILERNFHENHFSIQDDSSRNTVFFENIYGDNPNDRKQRVLANPYDTYWPSRSSYFGICDLAGLPKDQIGRAHV